MDEETLARNRQTAMRAARRDFQRKFQAAPIAHSVDGKAFEFQSSLASSLPVGRHVRLIRQDGVVLLGQVLAQQIESTEGPELRITDETDERLVTLGVSVSEATIRLARYLQRGSGVILGVIDADSATSPLDHGFDDAEIIAATPEDVGTFLSTWEKHRAALPLGTVGSSTDAIAASIDAAGFNRHSFLCGQSGSGKTYSLGVVLEQLLVATDLRIAIVDPNADYVRLGSLRDSVAELSDRETEYLQRVADLQVLRPVVDDDGSSLLRIRFSDLSPDDQARTLQLDPLTNREEFDTFWSMVNRVGTTSYGLNDVRLAGQADLSESSRQVQLRIANLGVAKWDIWANNDESSLSDILASDWHSLVLDVSRFERPVERSVVALATLRHFWRHRESRNPVLLVIDEAHNVCPSEPLDGIQEAATELMITIAGEGRKYGIYLFLSTQRPDKLHPNVISQCDNLMLMRMNSQADIEDLARIFSFVPPGMLREASGFRQGEALLAGKIVPSPTIMRIGQRLSEEGGVDVPTTWAHRSSP